MDTTKCISNSEWEAFSQGKLSEAEKARVLLHAAQCEICADVLEGIKAMKNPANLSNRVQQIQQELDRKVNPKKTKILPLYYWLAAASLVLVSTLYFIQLDTGNDQQLVVQYEKPQDNQEKMHGENIESAPASDEKIPQTTSLPKTRKDNKPVLSDQPKAIKEAPISHTDAEKSLGEEVKIDNQTKAPTEAPVATAATHAKEPQENDDQAFSETTTTEKVAKESATILALEKKQKRTTQKKIYSLPANAAANNQLENNAYMDNSVLNPKLSNQGLNDSLLIQKAKEERARNQFDSSSFTLGSILQKVNSLFYEEALWIHANNCLRKGDKTSAVPVLKNIVALGGKYAAQANALLTEIGTK